MVPLLLFSASVCFVPPAGLAAQPVQQVPAIPDSAAGRQFTGWLKTFNSGDAEAFDAHMRAEYPSWSAPPGATRELWNLTGGFEAVRVEETSESGIAVLLKERNWDAYRRVTIDVDQSGKIIRALIQSAPTPPDASPIARTSEREALVALEAKLDEASGSGAFFGAMRVSRNGETVFDYVSGQADRERGVPNTRDTKFRIGSMNKMFTAVAILQLVEAGKITLDTPIATYLPHYPNKDLASRVTVKHLLTHTGGTGDFFGPQFMERRLQLCEHSDYVALFGSRDVAFEPGERFAYSNYGFLLLGAIIEAVSGRSYYDHVQEHVYAPAGMTASNSLPEAVAVPGRSVGYTTRLPGSDGEWQPNTDTLPCRGTAAGGGYSTVGDLIRFSEALRGGKLLSPQMLEAATSQQVAAAPGVGYGYGFAVIELNGARTFGHDGGALGMAASLMMMPDLGYDVAVAANMDTDLTGRLVEFVGARLPAAARAQSSAATEPPLTRAEGDDAEIVVTARTEPPIRGEAYDQAVELSRVERYRLIDEALPRFWAPICPGVAGLKVESAEWMVARIRATAERAGIRLAKADCSPNLIVAFVESGRSLLTNLQRQQPGIFRLVSADEQSELTSETDQVRVWSNMAWRWMASSPPPSGWPKQRGSHGGAWSRAATPEARDIVSALVVIDRAAVRGKTLTQLADYVTVRGLSHSRPADGDEALDTILGLFAPGAQAPAEMTAFDIGYLRSLYEAPPNRPAGHMLLKVRRLSREQEAGSTASQPPGAAGN
jgi:CubicO group peptidase (beta-lactamase class C family)